MVLAPQKILVAIDRSPASEKVFQQALSLVKALGAEMMLLHVLSPEESTCPKIIPPTPILGGYTELSTVGIENFRQEWKKYAREGLELLQARVSEALAAGVEAQCHQAVGSPGRKICHFAETWSADTIVMGRRGLSEFSEFFRGSVSNYVFHRARCSVWIVRS